MLYEKKEKKLSDAGSDPGIVKSSTLVKLGTIKTYNKTVVKLLLRSLLLKNCSIVKPNH